MVGVNMNYIEMSIECERCRLVNDDVSCKECQELGRCGLIEIGDDKK